MFLEENHPTKNVGIEMKLAYYIKGEMMDSSAFGEGRFSIDHLTHDETRTIMEGVEEPITTIECNRGKFIKEKAEAFASAQRCIIGGKEK